MALPPLLLAACVFQPSPPSPAPPISPPDAPTCILQVKDTQFQRTVPYYVDDSAFRARYPGFTPTSIADGVKATVAWYKEQAAQADKA
jgi:hypothetical protein